MSDAYYDIASGGSASAIRAGLNTMNRKLVNVSLPVEVAITDADVAMVANRRYRGSIASFTADRNYTLPAGTAGDIIEVHLTAGDDTYELILLGASGVSINGGSAATEWSRLFISNERVRFICNATNDWRVEYDGRVLCVAEIRQTVLQAIAVSTHTTIDFNSTIVDTGNCVSLVNNNVVARRAGNYLVMAHASLDNLLTNTRFITSILQNSTQKSFNSASMGNSTSVGGWYMQAQQILQLAAGDTTTVQLFWDGGQGSGNENTTVSAETTQPKLYFCELL